ncbi:MAG: DUF2905 domain-containing protein [Desulfobulbaceae bacterium]|uniref:DUF2905 domain-containing protein n=1 Tax=Candidatus Desulfatifera sulfidica TaxID=2841691 RepID=A0A8J6NC38_9BACT|nr:DUF2905 domain-containing protein [Candidatus Desulfatifera sulfidica]
MGAWIIKAGVVLIIIGTILHVAPWLISWFGRLPGDIRLETEKVKVFIPITSMVLISAVFTLLFNLLRR